MDNKRECCVGYDNELKQAQEEIKRLKDLIDSVYSCSNCNSCCVCGGGTWKLEDNKNG